MADKTSKWWSKRHHPGYCGSFGGSHSSGCNRQNLKRKRENAGQEFAKRQAKESTMDELVAFALEGDPEASSIRTREVTRTIMDDLVKSEPEDSIDPVREMTPLTGDDECQML